MTMSRLWKAREILNEAIAPKSVSGQWPSLIGKILAARGFFETDAVESLLFPKLSSLKDPLELKGMEKALERLGRAYLNKEKICIYADFDLDGTSGLALLKQGLLALGFPEVLHYQPKRLSEGYGFHVAAVEDLHRQGVSVIITVDVGITAHAAVNRAQELGVDVILTDHHLPADSVPEAYVIVNPNQGDCPSGLGYLCGAGVAFYLLRGLKRYFHDHPDLPKNDWDLKEVLDYFTIGTLTDMVPLVDDNRVLVKHGLVKLENTDKAGLRALLEELDLVNRPLTSQDVAIRFAPKLNALSRMESGVLPVDIFLLEDAAKARSLVREVMKNNSTRVQLQSSAETEAMDLLKDWPHEEFVFVASQNFHRGIVGLIATKLSQVYNKPAFVGSVGSDGMIVGSARLPGGLEACLVTAMGEASEILSRFGGHSAAAGFEIAESRVPIFLEKLAGHFNDLKEKPKPLEIFYDVDARLSDVGIQLMKWYDFVGPFGAGFTIPVIHFSQIQILSVRELKGGHLRLRVSDQTEGSAMEALLFTPTPQQVECLQSAPGLFNVLGELQWNYFGGQKTVQILVKDLQVHPR
ncbi:single-strand DNA-specific exonuclease [Bdellovibrio bacteriovorus W]|nr:single-strand DNA-specific exonuclease [Bdellovibrio bacteriovorus W]